MSKRSTRRKITKNTKAQFGKYKGRLISWIVENDLQYAIWLAKYSNSTTTTKRAAQSLLDKKKTDENKTNYIR